MQRLDERYKSEHAEISWRAISGMRNILVHDYFEVDFESVWRIVERDLAPLDRRGRLSYFQLSARSTKVRTQTPVGPLGISGLFSSSQPVPAMSRWTQGMSPAHSFMK